MPSWGWEFAYGFLVLCITFVLPPVLLLRIRHTRRRIGLPGAVSLAALILIVLGLHVGCLGIVADTAWWLLLEEVREESIVIFNYFTFTSSNPAFLEAGGKKVWEDHTRPIRYQYIRGGFGFVLEKLFLLRDPPPQPDSRGEYQRELESFLTQLGELRPDRIVDAQGTVAGEGGRTMRPIQNRSDRSVDPWNPEQLALSGELHDFRLEPRDRDRMANLYQSHRGSLFHDYYTLDRQRFRRMRPLIEDVLPYKADFFATHGVSVLLWGLYVWAMILAAYKLAGYSRRLAPEIERLRIKALLTDSWSDGYMRAKATIECRYLLANRSRILRDRRKRRMRLGLTAGLIGRYILGESRAAEYLVKERMEGYRLLKLAEHMTKGEGADKAPVEGKLLGGKG